MNAVMIKQAVMEATSLSLTIATPTGVPKSVSEFVTRILDVVIPLVAIIFVGLLIYGGIMYMMSTGDPGKVKTAQSIIINAVIGFVIVSIAFLIRLAVSNAIFG